MSIDDEHSAGDAVTTASSPAESDTNEFDNWFGVPPNLVCDGADLSKCRSDVLSQSFEEIFAAEELLPIVSEPDENTLALLNQGAAMQEVELGQISQVSTPMPTPFLIPTLSSPCYNPNAADQQAIPKIAITSTPYQKYITTRTVADNIMVEGPSLEFHCELCGW
jgi:hypothetical protein